MRRYICLLLSAALLLGAAGCGGGQQSAGSGAGGTSPGGLSFLPDWLRPKQEEEPIPDAYFPEEPGPRPGDWDEEHTLDREYTPVEEGELELPIEGATGYASVELPLWSYFPPDGLPEPEEPDPSGTPGDQSSPGWGVLPDGSSSQAGSSSAPSGDAPEAEPDPYEGALAVLPAGTAFTVLKEEGDWWLVSVPDSFLQEDGEEGEDETEAGGAPLAATALSEVTEIPGPAGAPEGQTPPENPEDPGPAGTTPPAEVTEPEPAPEPEGDSLVSSFTGWIEHKYCMVNLPDVVPSIIYDATNSYSSLFMSCGRIIPGITGQALYAGAVYNPRLSRDEFLMPVLYSMAKRVCHAQQLALSEGNCIILYEGYRPHETQTAVLDAVSALAKKDAVVKEGVASPPWNIAWFISTGYSNHQRGFAMDVGLAKIRVSRETTLGDYTYLRATNYVLYGMPTIMHELSKAAATFTEPVASHSPTAWKNAEMTETMKNNKPALALQRYCTEAGLTPLASEWWHFNDLNTREQVLDNLGTGGFQITDCLSTLPFVETEPADSPAE